VKENLVADFIKTIRMSFIDLKFAAESEEKESQWL